MKIGKAVLDIIILSVVLCGCGQTQNTTISETTTEQTTEIATTQEEPTTEATTEATTERIPEKGSAKDPYKSGETATISAYDFKTAKRVDYEVTVDGWEGNELTGTITIVDADTDTAIKVWGSSLIPYLYRENYVEISNSTTSISTYLNATIIDSEYELHMLAGGSTNVYYCPTLYSDTDSLSDIKYVVFKYLKYSDDLEVTYDTELSNECWFEIPRYEE